jgi:hypothetical protein
MELRKAGRGNAAGLRTAERAMALAEESIAVLSILMRGEGYGG